MQNQNIDQSKVLRREDEMTDISKMPLSQVKPQEFTTQQPASQRSTMQSVSLGEVPTTGNEETILGSVASIHDQMQPGSFMSPISDRKSGSIENLSAEERPISSEAALNNFAHKAVGKIEEFVHAAQDLAHTAADKIAEFAKDLTSESNKAQFTSEAERLMQSAQSGAQELMQNITKKAYLVRRSVTRKLGKRGEEVQKKAALGAGIAKVYAKEELKDLKRKTRRFARNVDQDASISKRSFQKKGAGLERKVKAFQRDFEAEATLAGDALRQGAFDLRQKARRMINELPKNARLARDSFISEIKAELAPSTESTSQFQSAPSKDKFLVEFSASEWNGTSGKAAPRSLRGNAPTETFESSPSKWSVEIPAHDWNESSELAARQQAGFLLTKAQDYLKRASKQYTFAQKRIQSQSGFYMKGARKYYREAVKKSEDISTMIKGQVNELVDQATRRFGDSTIQNRPTQQRKEKVQSFVDRTVQKGQEILGDLDEVKDSAMRKLIEKKAEMQFQAELLTADKFPSQEALSRKQAINSEIRSLYGKENLPQ